MVVLFFVANGTTVPSPRRFRWTKKLRPPHRPEFRYVSHDVQMYGMRLSTCRVPHCPCRFLPPRNRRRTRVNFWLGFVTTVRVRSQGRGTPIVENEFPDNESKPKRKPEPSSCRISRHFRRPVDTRSPHVVFSFGVFFFDQNIDRYAAKFGERDSENHREARVRAHRQKNKKYDTSRGRRLKNTIFFYPSFFSPDR